MPDRAKGKRFEYEKPPQTPDQQVVHQMRWHQLRPACCTSDQRWIGDRATVAARCTMLR
ncbi:AAEL000601-PA [Aedes aegypti]|uniref:AAEL000601-PA n=1 Tax=Aedes aegypti TaxID=7159 RepID=Q17NS0_AEDAE|nr:AAEL000601-PA [Aedes aegypti]